MFSVGSKKVVEEKRREERKKGESRKIKREETRYIERGADVDIPQREGLDWSPLHFAAYMGITDSCRVLLEFGADQKVKKSCKSRKEKKNQKKN